MRNGTFAGLAPRLGLGGAQVGDVWDDMLPSLDEASDLGIHIGRAYDVVVVSAAGAIDLRTAPQLADAVETAHQQAASFVLDLEKVDFLSSAGLSVLVAAAQRARDAGGRLAIVTTNRTVLRAIEVTGLDAVLSLFDSGATAADFVLGP